MHTCKGVHESVPAESEIVDAAVGEWQYDPRMSTFKFFASIVLFAALLLAVLYGPAYLFLGGPMLPVYWMVIPALIFGLTVTAAIDKPLTRPER